MTMPSSSSSSPSPSSSTSSSMGGSPRASVRRRRRQKTEGVRPHGWQRTSDLPAASPTLRDLGNRRRSTPAGTSLLLTLIVGVLTAIGIARVRTTTRVLELGAEITELTTEQANLLDQRRRLAAERAFLRHPEHIAEVARNHLQMIPMSPDLVQAIRLQAPEPQSQGEAQPQP